MSYLSVAQSNLKEDIKGMVMAIDVLAPAVYRLWATGSAYEAAVCGAAAFFGEVIGLYGFVRL